MASLPIKGDGRVGFSVKPLVSVCIPTFNGARWIRECLTSALAQSYQPIEVLVVDDASTDGTAELVQSLKDERTRLIINERNLGTVNNWNKCIELARGAFIKFLFHDDILYPDCIAQMMTLFLSHENLGLVFSARDIIVEGNTATLEAKAWLNKSTLLHTRFDSIGMTNNGQELFHQYLRKGLQGNWIGEPSSVLVRKECFSRLGLFNQDLYQVCDVEMWLRIMFFYDIGFLPEKLSAFRFHINSTSASNSNSRRNCLDQLWLVDSLLSVPEIKAAYPEIETIRGVELLRLVKSFLRAPVKVTRCLRSDPVGRRGFLLLPTWAKSAFVYALARLFRRNSAVQ